ncbi:hypothetical protein ACFRMQ_10620 [Kitasatospora sp. NPDC056783]|uniref:hypothetical protein n=1 Tax=Kitasatospora sp. NPDC056783 TaxID=3345943 RepID=UPI00367EA9F3
MRKNNRAVNRARRLAPAVALTAALVAGGAATAAPAFAAIGSHSVSAVGVFANDVASGKGASTVNGIGVFGN